jgi:hypothetical protein
MLTAVPIEREAACAFVDKLHRHHDGVRRDKYRVAAMLDGRIVGIVQVGRPVSRALCDGKTVEVVRLCTDGTPNVCSYLYAKAARVARELGYERIVTYILDTEDGTSLKAAGWRKEADIKGHAWGCPSRPRQTTAPTCDKQRWAKRLRGPEPGGDGRGCVMCDPCKSGNTEGGGQG